MTQRWSRLALALAILLALGTTGVGAQEPAADPATAPSATISADRVAQIIEGMTLRQKVGQLFMSRVYGSRAADPSAQAAGANRRYLGVDDAAELLSRFHVGSIVYFEYAGNLQRPVQVAELSKGIQEAALEAGLPPILISTDQEHGVIRRLGPPATRFPGSMALGATRDADLARGAARVTGEELRAVGIGQVLAPVADVNSDPANPVIGVRSFGSRPGLVAEMTEAQVRGFGEDARIAATVKHFPGHGDTDLDSHTALPTIRGGIARWWAVDAPPFEAAIEAGVDVVMTAHVVVPALDDRKRPATLSWPILTGILRDEMGYDGVIMTDSLSMAAVQTKYRQDRVPVLALQAGADILADPPHLPTAYRAVLAAVEAGAVSEERLDTSVARILRLKERLGLFDEPLVDPAGVEDTLGSADHQALAASVGEASVTVLRDQKGWLPLPPRWSLNVTGPKTAGATDLAKALRSDGRTVQTSWTRADPNARQISAAVRAGRGHDVTIVVTEYLGAHRAQRNLVRRLLESGQRIIVVYAGSPYDAGWFPRARAQIATYSTAPVSMRGLAHIVSGTVSPTGKLPVRVPYPGRPGRALFPFGAGRSW